LWPVRIEFMHGRAKAATTLPVSVRAAICLSLACVCRCSTWIPIQTSHARCLKHPASMCEIREKGKTTSSVDAGGNAANGKTSGQVRTLALVWLRHTCWGVCVMTLHNTFCHAVREYPAEQVNPRLQVPARVWWHEIEQKDTDLWGVHCAWPKCQGWL
jgi:hypothetical protein